jgi:hypothetical protein
VKYKKKISLQSLIKLAAYKPNNQKLKHMSKGRNFTLKTPFKSGSSKLQRGPQTIKIPSFFSGTSIAMLGSSQI